MLWFPTSCVLIQRASRHEFPRERTVSHNSYRPPTRAGWTRGLGGDSWDFTVSFCSCRPATSTATIRLPREGCWRGGSCICQPGPRETKTKLCNVSSLEWPDISGHGHEFPMSPPISIFPDIVLVLISLLFLCFAIMALCIRNRPTGDEFGAIMEEAMRLVSRSMLVPIFIANSLWPYYIPYYICSYRREGFEEDWEISGGKRS